MVLHRPDTVPVMEETMPQYSTLPLPLPEMPVRQCVVCGKAFTRRRCDNPARFANRLTCSLRCADVRRKQTRTKDMGEKVCTHCAKTFTRNPDERSEHYRIRRTCSAECRIDIVKRKHCKRFGTEPVYRPDPVCVVCGRSIPRPEGMYETQWKRLKTCSVECGMSQRARLMRQSATSIEVKTKEALDALGIDHRTQVRFGNYLADFYLPAADTVIECYGDYWHANPALYPDRDNLSKIQQRHAENDPAREAYIRGRCHRLVILWEADIKQRGAEALLREALGVT